jgi:Holliday junction resolvasome RuvABC endonuclease subunit
MNILALDLGSKTGYAIYKNGEILSGTRELRHDKSASGVRFLNFCNWLVETISAHNIYMVFFERVYAHKGVEAAHVYGAFMYILAMVCEGLNVGCVGLNVGTIKKFATGKGNATKEEMIAAARSRGFDPVDDNEADALAILFVGLHDLKFQKNKRYCLAKGESGTPSPGFSLASEIFLKEVR